MYAGQGSPKDTHTVASLWIELVTPIQQQDDYESSEEVLPLYMMNFFCGLAGGSEIQPSG